MRLTNAEVLDRFGYVQCSTCNTEQLKENVADEGTCKWCRKEV
jgi:hypothetical protein